MAFEALIVCRSGSRQDVLMMQDGVRLKSRRSSHDESTTTTCREMAFDQDGILK